MDRDWVDASERRVAYYKNLKPGDYTFTVLAANSDGVWNESGKSLRMRLLPHVWQTTWFLGVGIFASVAAVAGISRYAAWSMLQRRLRRLEQQHAIHKERSRIAQDMHDDLGARLSEILLLSELNREPDAKRIEVESRLTRISHAAKDLVDNLDAIIWAVNPKNDSFDRFVFYLLEYVPRYLEATSVRPRFDVPDPLPSTPLSSAQRHNLFLVIKEALHNVVKHAEASELRLSIRVENDHVLMRIEDNGLGFSIGNGKSFSNGLTGMKERIHRLHGVCEIRSTPNVGTIVSLSIPFHVASPDA